MSAQAPLSDVETGMRVDNTPLFWVRFPPAGGLLEATTAESVMMAHFIENFWRTDPEIPPALYSSVTVRGTIACLLACLIPFPAPKNW